MKSKAPRGPKLKTMDYQTMKTMNGFYLKTPVLFLVFNRPDTTQRVFEAIRAVRPERLFIASDGPREGNNGDKEKCERVRNIVTDIDWDCEVRTLFREKNLGCKNGVSSGIDWFFSQVDEGIILEDDCLPMKSFFRFCEELLQRYRNDNRVMQICGSNSLCGWRRNDDSYYFSGYGPIWGWASWRRAWIYYDVDMKAWPEVREKKIYLDFFDRKREAYFRLHLYDRVFAGEIDTWDYQWGFAKMLNSGLSVTPNVSLISNIGFGDDATHTATPNSVFANMQTSNINFPLRHPKFVCRDRIADWKYFKNYANQYIIKCFLWKLQSFSKRLGMSI